MRVVIGRLLALGYCAPAEQRFADRAVRAWRLEPPRPDESPISGPSPTGAATLIAPLERVSAPAPRTSDLYAPPEGAEVWAPGVYVFRVDFGNPRESRWFGVEVMEEGVASPSLRPAP